MTLQVLIEKVKHLESLEDEVEQIFLDRKDILKLCHAAEEMREYLGLMAEGEGRDHKVYMTMSKAAINKADQICKE